jgi:hypothetical protein
MKSLAQLVLSACLAVSIGAAAENTRQFFSFDNGEGLAGTSTYYTFNSRHGDFHAHNGTPVSRYLLHQSIGTGTLHYGGTLAGDEQHYYGGVSLGPATLAYFQGEGESFSKADNPLYADLNQYFFHGGSRADFEFQGIGANLDLPGGISTQFAFTSVRAANVRDRDGYYAGVAGRFLELGVFELDNGGDRTGKGLNLGFNAGRLDLDLQDIRSEFGARVRRVALNWDGRRSIEVSLELEQMRNDLYSRDDEQRVMLRIRKRFGRTPVFSAAEDSEDAGDNGRPGFGKAVAIGVGVGAAAAALGSGSGSNGAPRFAERNEAARSVLNRINPVSVQQNIEHGGWIYRNADNSFSYTQPVAGTVDSVNIGNPQTTVPNGTAASASYHTHGGPDPRYDNENFSPQDLLSDRLAGVDGYLGTPAGFMKLHNMRTGTITVVGRINN